MNILYSQTQNNLLILIFHLIKFLVCLHGEYKSEHNFVEITIAIINNRDVPTKLYIYLISNFGPT